MKNEKLLLWRVPVDGEAYDEAATKLIYLALRNITKKWKRPPKEWHAAKAQLAIQFGSRFVIAA